MRKLFLLAIVVGVLISTGILSVTWSNGTAVIKYDKQKAKEESVKLIKKAREIKDEIEDELDDEDEQTTNTTQLPQPPQR